MHIRKFSDIKKNAIKKTNEQEVFLSNASNFSNLSSGSHTKMANTQPQELGMSQSQITQDQPQTPPQQMAQQYIQQTSQSQQAQQQPQQQVQVQAQAGSGVTVVNFFSKLFESREMAHMYHLQTKGSGAFAQHMALGAYYEAVINYIDELVETYQGQYDLIEGYDVIDTKETGTKDKVAYFTELATYIKAERKIISAEDTHLHNIIDEIVALVYKTLYKLRFLN
jgi:hypothetical protein